MNLVGKIFVGIITAMSAVAFALALFIAAKHTNWQEVARSHKKQVTEIRQDIGKLQSLKETLETQQQAAQSAQQKTTAALSTTETSIKNDYNSSLSLYQDQEKEMQFVAESMVVNNTAFTEAQAMIATLSGELDQSRTLRAAYLRDLAKTINKKYEFQSVIDMLEQKNIASNDTYAKMIATLRKNGLNPDPSLYPATPPYTVIGMIESLQRDSGNLLMVSIGTSDGLQPGHLLEVFRGPSYLGRVRVLTTEPNRAVCEVLAAYRKGTFHEGDSVTSKLSN